MKAFTLALALAAVVVAAPVAQDGCGPANPHSQCKRDAAAEAEASTLNTRVGQFAPNVCYGDVCTKKREAAPEAEAENTPAITPWIYTGGQKRSVAERDAKEKRKAKTVNTRVNGSQNYTGNGKRKAKTVNTRVNGSQNYTGPGGTKREAKTVNTRVNGSQNYTGPGGTKREAEPEAN